MAAIHFTESDRDERGFIKAPAPPNEPRSLADLLPHVGAPTTPAAPRVTSHTETLITIALVGIAIVTAIYRFSIPAAPAVAPIPTAAPASVPTIAPAATAPPVVMLPAYAAPDGAQLGTIEATRAITPLAHYGADWIQADVSGSGLIWLRSSDWPSLAIVGPDLAPRPVIAAAPAPYVPPAPPPAPEPCAEAGIPGRMVSVCGDGDLDALAKAKWIATYGGNIGVVGHPTPQIKETQ